MKKEEILYTKALTRIPAIEHFRYSSQSILEAMEEYAIQERAKAIAEHEARQWKRYPENMPKVGQKCLITFWDGEVAIGTIWGENAPWDEDNVIAFRELPKPYQEEKP